MRRFTISCAAAIALVTSTSAFAQDDFEQRFYAQVGEWQVRKLKTPHSGCNTSRDSNAGDMYGMTYGQGRPAMLDFALANFVSKGRSTRELEIRFVGRAGEQERSWGKHAFSVVELETGGTIFLSELLAVNILDAYAANGTLRIYADGKLLATFPLDGAGPAIAKLRECAASVALPN